MQFKYRDLAFLNSIYMRISNIVTLSAFMTNYINTHDDYDYTAINNLLSENTIENFRKGEKREIGNILLTGVTGYLGIHVLSNNARIS